MFLRLECQEGLLAGRSLASREARITVGRSREAEFRLPSEEQGVSGRHCLLFRRGDDWFVRDLGSTNGTLLNGFPVTGDLVVEAGDTLRFGKKGPLFLVCLDPENETLALPLAAIEPRGPARRRALLGLVLLLVLVVAALVLRGLFPDLLRRSRGGPEPGDPAKGSPGILVPDLDPAPPAELVEEAEVPLAELPPLEDWILGRWTRAVTEGMRVLGPDEGGRRLRIAIERSPEEPDLYLARSLELGPDLAAEAALGEGPGRVIFRFRYLRERSERGGVAYFRVSRYDARRAAEGGDGFSIRNDYAWVDIRRRQMLGNVGAWLKEEPP